MRLIKLITDRRNSRARRIHKMPVTDEGIATTGVRSCEGEWSPLLSKLDGDISVGFTFLWT